MAIKRFYLPEVYSTLKDKLICNEMSHKNFRAIYANCDENFYGELHSLPRSISGWPKKNKINT